VKSMVYETEAGLCLVVVNGSRQVSETKLKNALGAQWLRLAEAETVDREFGAPLGSLGPLGVKVPVLVDAAVPLMPAMVCGANREGFHCRHVVYGRDFSADRVLDLVEVVAGDPCPRCGAPLKIVRGIEVGHIFKLGTKYSRALKATFLDREGKEQLLVMGCYGIGVGRTVAAAIEQHHDQQGIIFPWAIAPFKVVLLGLDSKNEEVTAFGDRLYRQLRERGLETLYDDRDERPGIKFKDADLIGAPLRITVGRKGFARGVIEVRERRTGAQEEIPVDDLEKLWRLIERLRDDDQSLSPV
ncbi:MAG: proline--tRNA ligase, partial [Deltaproteobacteria bacterium]|nr:proline--tRNA ligase [Deltaproteobacteria bacterium]